MTPVADPKLRAELVEAIVVLATAYMKNWPNRRKIEPLLRSDLERLLSGELKP